MKVAIIGLGEFGQAMAIGLARGGVEVIAIDSRMERIDAVKDEVAMAVCTDARNRETLKQHGVDQVDVLIAAMGENFEAQVLVVVHATQFGIPRVVARATTADHRLVLLAVGAHDVFDPEEEAARWMSRRLMLGDISSYFEFAEGFSLVEAKAPPSLVGKTLRELNLRNDFRINLVALKRFTKQPDGTLALHEFNPVPRPDQQILENDVLALVGSVLDLANFMGEFGENK